ncbi:cytoadherence factor, partial [Salmonella enterica subsp. enterica serovar Enteritidis]|nr:cytoadherence factor [Salmonella enterica subsp. enterica serovar Enteritidis]
FPSTVQPIRVKPTRIPPSPTPPPEGTTTAETSTSENKVTTISKEQEVTTKPLLVRERRSLLHSQ